MHRLFAVIVLACAIVGCGQKGPLYFAENPPPGVKPPKTDPYKPVPYPKDMERDSPGK